MSMSQEPSDFEIITAINNRYGFKPDRELLDREDPREGDQFDEKIVLFTPVADEVVHMALEIYYRVGNDVFCPQDLPIDPNE